MTKIKKNPTGREITAELIEIYYNTNYKSTIGLFTKRRREEALKEYIDKLAEIFGFAEQINKG